MLKRLMLALSTLLLVLTLAGCVHKIDIQQGNAINPAKAKRVTLGMTSGQVVSLLGRPVLVNLFAQEQMVYVYTFKHGRGETVHRHLTVTFRRNHVTHVNTGTGDNY